MILSSHFQAIQYKLVSVHPSLVLYQASTASWQLIVPSIYNEKDVLNVCILCTLYTLHIVVYFSLYTKLCNIQCTHCCMYSTLYIVHILVCILYTHIHPVLCSWVNCVRALYKIYESGRSCEFTTTNSCKLSSRRKKEKIRNYTYISFLFPNLRNTLPLPFNRVRFIVS